MPFSMAQAMAVCEAYLRGRKKAEAAGIVPKPIFVVQQGGRLDEYLLETALDNRIDIDPEVIFAAELIGVTVFCEGSEIGKIVDVLDYPGNKVYVVKGRKEYMIPAVKQFVLATDMEANRMDVELIEGMRTDEG